MRALDLDASRGYGAPEDVNLNGHRTTPGELVSLALNKAPRYRVTEPPGRGHSLSGQCCHQKLNRMRRLMVRGVSLVGILLQRPSLAGIHE